MCVCNLFSLLFVLLLCSSSAVFGHGSGGARGGDGGADLLQNSGSTFTSYHTDQLGGNVWIFNGEDERVKYMQRRATTGGNSPSMPAYHAGHKQMTIGNKTVFFDAVNALVPWEFNAKALGTDQVVDSIVEGATFTRPFRGGIEQRFLQPFEFHIISDESLTDYPLLQQKFLNLKDDPKLDVELNITTKADVSLIALQPNYSTSHPLHN